MEIVIKIPENTYEATCNGCMLPPHVENVVEAIKNGKPLPGHGDLIDRQALIDNGIGKGFCNWYDEIKYADAIIKADKGVLEKINEKQNSLRATCKAWDEAIEKDGYVN